MKINILLVSVNAYSEVSPVEFNGTYSSDKGVWIAPFVLQVVVATPVGMNY